MTAISRLNDIGIGVCPCHVPSPRNYTTVMALVAATTRNNALGVANLNTVGISNCGHPTIPLLGSTTTRVEGAAVHRLGDVGQNCGTYTMVLGSSDTRVNT